MDRQEWLKSLKIGDKVANEIKVGFNNEKAYEFLEVKNVTAKGNIRLTNGILLNSNGFYSKYENWRSTRYEIEPITNEILEYEKNRREYNNLKGEVRGLIDNFSRYRCSIEDLKQLKEILSKYKDS